MGIIFPIECSTDLITVRVKSSQRHPFPYIGLSSFGWEKGKANVHGIVYTQTLELKYI